MTVAGTAGKKRADSKHAESGDQNTVNFFTTLTACDSVFNFLQHLDFTLLFIFDEFHSYRLL